MINLEIPKKFKPLASQANQVATEVFRPISRKYDEAEHSYPKELDMLASLIDGMNEGSDIGIESNAMRLATYRAASRADRGESFSREAAIARKLCTTKGMQIGSDGVQLLGGHGFVKEHPVERWYRDLRAIAIMEGALLA